MYVCMCYLCKSILTVINGFVIKTWKNTKNKKSDLIAKSVILILAKTT